MKYILYLIVGFVLCSCQKEDILSSEKIVLNDFYAIQDDPNDSIQHRRYEIYKTYGVSVLFNDTVGKTFLKVNEKNDSVFIWETVDINWNYTGVRGYNYEYFYMTKPESQSLMLNFVESYLEKTSKVLYPYCILIVDSLYASNKNSLSTYGTMRKGKQTMDYGLGFRSMFLAGMIEETAIAGLVNNIMLGQIRGKIGHFKEKLEAFNLVSKPEWYGKLWLTDLSIPSKIKIENITYDFGVGYAMSDTYSSLFAPRPETQEARDAIEKEVRKCIGGFGFVGGDTYVSPNNPAEDVDIFISEMLRRSPEKFAELWGTYPLVMKKYGILYDIIVHDMEIEL